MSRLLDRIRQAAHARSEHDRAAGAGVAASDGAASAAAGQSLLVQAMQRNSVLQVANSVGTLDVAAESAAADNTRARDTSSRQSVFVAAVAVAAAVAFSAGYWAGRPASTATVSAPATISPSSLQLRLDRDFAGVARRIESSARSGR